MPQPKVDVGSGTSLTLKIGATAVFTGEVLGIAWSGIAAEAIDVTHMGTAAAALPPALTAFGSRIFMPGDHVDPGTLKLDIHHNPGELPPLSVLMDLVLSWPLPAGMATPTKWGGQCIGVSYEAGAVLEGKMTGSLTLKLSGVQTLTAAA